MDKNVPKLRFKGFTDDWEQRKFGEIVEIERGGSPRPIEKYITTNANGLNWVKIGDAPEYGRYITHTSEKIIPEGLSKTREVKPGDLILSNSMSFGRPYIMAINGCIHDGWLLIRDINKVFDLKFLCHMLGTPNMLNQYKMFAAGSTVNNLNKELVGNAKVTIPKIQEQRVIGDLLENLDKTITLHQRKLNSTKKLKAYFLQNMFPAAGENKPKIRFAGFTDDWEQRKLGDISEKVVEKNIKLTIKETFTNSAEFGVVSQRDFFDHDISNADNIGGYYIIQQDDFVYNPRISTTAPVGPINRNKLGRSGIMSPLYTVFRVHNVDYAYLEWFFKSIYWHPFMYYNGDTGARSDRFSIKDNVWIMYSLKCLYHFLH